jgi:flagellar protein FliO/FliZ
MMKKVLTAFCVISISTSFVFADSVKTETLSPAVVAASPAVTETAVARASETARLAEDQIPLSIGATKKAAEGGSTTAKAVMSMIIVLILTGTGFYFVRRYKFSNTINKSNTEIKVISQHYLGPKKSLAIIHVAGESILIGVTDQSISMIKPLSLIDDEVPANLPNTFGQTMAKVESRAENQIAPAMKKGQGAVSQSGQSNQSGSAAIELDEEFSFTNVTDTVSKKIKSMRSFS